MIRSWSMSLSTGAALVVLATSALSFIWHPQWKLYSAQGTWEKRCYLEFGLEGGAVTYHHPDKSKAHSRGMSFVARSVERIGPVLPFCTYREGYGFICIHGWAWLRCPLWIPFAALAVFAVSATAITALRKRRRGRLGLCVPCGYDLTGNLSGICPECGSNVGVVLRSPRW